jgi:acyl-coenzyme A synthetase/AMP-(fatty) acid ligase
MMVGMVPTLMAVVLAAAVAGLVLWVVTRQLPAVGHLATEATDLLALLLVHQSLAVVAAEAVALLPLVREVLVAAVLVGLAAVALLQVRLVLLIPAAAAVVVETEPTAATAAAES